jgi:hypothetical protein
MLDLAPLKGNLANVAVLTPMQEQRVLHTLTLAFEKDPPSRWLCRAASGPEAEYQAILRTGM